MSERNSEKLERANALIIEVMCSQIPEHIRLGLSEIKFLIVSRQCELGEFERQSPVAPEKEGRG